MARFKHDCADCVSMGQHNGHDLYWCDQHGLPTVIARDGDRGEQYKSGMVFVGHDPELTVAAIRARLDGRQTKAIT